jgi:hypothetical protein
VEGLARTFIDTEHQPAYCSNISAFHVSWQVASKADSLCNPRLSQGVVAV